MNIVFHIQVPNSVSSNRYLMCSRSGCVVQNGV